jgi:hypothetical protein
LQTRNLVLPKWLSAFPLMQIPAIHAMMLLAEIQSLKMVPINEFIPL